MKKIVSARRLWSGAIVIGALMLGGCQSIGGSSELNENEQGYHSISVQSQAPVLVDGVVSSKIDKAYSYNAEIGTITQVHVSDGQIVKKGDPLFTYSAKETDYELEDLNREQTNLYNQRELLVERLQRITGGTYNMQGDRIQISEYGEKGDYQIVEEIGTSLMPSRANNENSAESSGSDVSNVMGDDSDSIKESIRQINAQIKDVEIKLVRTQEKKTPTIKADYAGEVFIDERGQMNSSIPFVRIIGEGLVVQGSVDEYNYHVLKENLPVTVYVNAEDREVGGKVTSFDRLPQAQSSGESAGSVTSGSDVSSDATKGAKFGFIVEPDESIQIGFSTQLSLPKKGFSVPSEAIVMEEDISYVFKYVDGVVYKTKVTLEKHGIQEVIVKGVVEGDEIIVNPFGLSDREAIELTDSEINGMDQDDTSDEMMGTIEAGRGG